MIERHVVFNILEGREGDFEAFLEQRYLPAMSAQSGFKNVAILRELENSRRYQMALRFEDLETAAAWRGSAVHKELSPVLKSFYSESEVIVYDVRITQPG
jgi:heme-degrading monooxygenase HmoA